MQFLTEEERVRVSRALAARQVRVHLAPSYVSWPLALASNLAWPALGLLGVAATATALAALTGVLPYLFSEAVVGTYRTPLVVPLLSAMFIALLTVPLNVRVVVNSIREFRASGRSAWLPATPDLEDILSIAASLLGSVLIGLGALNGGFVLAWCVEAGAWGPHARTGIASTIGLVAGLTGRYWDRLAARASARMFGGIPRLRSDDQALFVLAWAASSSAQMLDGGWRRRPEVKKFRRLLIEYAQIVNWRWSAGQLTRWYEWRARRQVRQPYFMLAAILNDHADAVLTAHTQADWQQICQSLTSGAIHLVDGDWAGLLASYPLKNRRERWVIRYGPRLVTSTVTAIAAIVLPLLPGLGGQTGTSIRVFLGVIAVLAIAPDSNGGYESVRSALSASLPWKNSK